MTRLLFTLLVAVLGGAGLWTGCSPAAPATTTGNGGSSGSSGSSGTSGGAGVPNCTGGTALCGNQCVSQASDPSNCGGCGRACSPGGACVNGVCQCPAATPTQCGTTCTNTLSDPLNCSATNLCGTVCGGTTPNCSNGTCSASCAAGLQDCGGGRCVNPATFMTDPTNCGGCGIACTGGRTCNAGSCACPAGQELCAATNACVPTGTCNLGTGGTGGGAGTGGTGTGGTAGTGGGSAGTGGGGGDGTAPPGYWTSGAWHGCSWTGVGTAGTSTISPQDFVSKPPAAGYCVSGTVGAEPMYQSVALLGFNTGEPPPASCAYKPVDVNADGPPGVTPMANGIAFDFVKRGANTGFTLRVQLQGPNGHKAGTVGENDRWCATITEVSGKVFVPYSAFTPKCWEMTDALKGTPYAGQPISAVVFLVPGSPAATPYDFCINSVVYGNSAADAPDGPETGGDQTGTVGGSGNDDLDFDRKKISVGGENYIIQNNNWGNPGGSDCIMSYINNSFTVTTCTGSGQSAPAAFPSIYQGNNGNTANGVLSTKTTDNMPIQISNIASINSTFRYSGNAGGSYNACYDIWFANSPPTTEYQDGINGFVMIWLRDPGDKQPIGGPPAQNPTVTIGGQSWNVYVGPRGDGPNGYNNAPVVSFVNPQQDDNSRNQNFVNKNILEFITAAQQHGIGSSMYLTDIFAGFEIWNGGVGLKVDEFTAVVTPR